MRLTIEMHRPAEALLEELRQPGQSFVAFLLAHFDSFHPSALRLSRGTFY
jgi:hypothetical protein